MKLFNTLSHKLEEFIPFVPGHVKMYTCGPTVYNYAHIGNLRTYISEDILEKTLVLLGYEVNRCMNITDVGHLVSDADTGDDKMSVAAIKEHKSVLEIASFYTDEFFNDIDKLNIKKPSNIIKATNNIASYINMIKILLEKGYAYIANGNVYFDTDKYSDYYKLSGRNKEELLVGAREDVLADEHKKNQADFGLWFTNSKFDSQELKWNSPWGIGYPGWHIECSCISIDILGEYLDIHCGAVDAIFPHHTNEIAQAECYLGHSWCKYWVHMEFLNDSTGKMSKSKGEFLTLGKLIEQGYDPLAYRFMCLQSHYRKQLVFTYESLDNAAIGYKKLKNKVMLLNGNDDIDNKICNDYMKKFKESLSNDLNTSLSITILYDVLKDNISDATKLCLIEKFDEVLGLGLLDQKEKNISDKEEYINDMINRRNEAKKNKDFIMADEIRDELNKQGIIIKDTREGTIFEIV